MRSRSFLECSDGRERWRAPESRGDSSGVDTCKLEKRQRARTKRQGRVRIHRQMRPRASRLGRNCAAQPIWLSANQARTTVSKPCNDVAGRSWSLSWPELIGGSSGSQATCEQVGDKDEPRQQFSTFKWERQMQLTVSSLCGPGSSYCQSIVFICTIRGAYHSPDRLTKLCNAIPVTLRSDANLFPGGSHTTVVSPLDRWTVIASSGSSP